MSQPAEGPAAPTPDTASAKNGGGHPLLLSVVMPCYNEAATVERAARRVLDLPLPLELIAVNDGSRDGSRDILERLAKDDPRLRVLHHKRNRGKGAALVTGFKAARGVFVVIQDADLEYHPQDFARLLEPALTRGAEVVFGSRFRGQPAVRVLFFWHMVANRAITLFSNLMNDLNLTDIEVCHKLFRREIIQAIPLRERRFGCEPELAARVAKLGCRIYEVGVSYDGRTYAEGKKIGLRDALWALICIARYGLFARSRRKPALPPLPEFCQRLGERLAQQDRERLWAAIGEWNRELGQP